MSDVAHPSYEKSIVSLREMRREVFSDLELEENETNSQAFERAAEWVAFEGTNVSIGRLRKLTREFLKNLGEES